MVVYKAPPSDDDPPEEVTDSEYTVLILESDEELLDERENELEKTNVRIKSGRSGSAEVLRPVCSVNQHADEDYINWMTVSVKALWKLMYEHRRYAEAYGFADSEMEVLRVIEFTNRERISTREIKNHGRVEEYSEGTIHKALNNLEEKGLINKHERGLYSYSGP